MTNEELKKKIINLLDEATGSWYEDEDGMFAEGYSAEEGDNRFKAHVADALIAAGMVDKSDYASMKETAVRYKAEVSKAKGRAKEAEHRAARAEKALMTVCVNVVTDEEDDIAVEPRARVLYKAYLKQAEKELEEEKDNAEI